MELLRNSAVDDLSGLDDDT